MKRKLILCSALALGLVLAAWFAEALCPFDPYEQNFAAALQPPSWEHWFGTDRFGRDMLSRVLMGARVSIFSALILVGIISVTGIAIGVVCGCSRRADAVLMRLADICLAFPGMVFGLAVAAVLGGGIQNAVLALAAVSWPKYARIARSQTLAVKNADYIAAARLAGDSFWQVIGRHILPNIAGTILVTAMLDVGTMMMELAGFSFLGLGAQPPTADWGSMMSEGRSMLQLYPWVIFTPGIGIVLSVAIFHLLGETIRDHMDPKNRTGRRRE